MKRILFVLLQLSLLPQAYAQPMEREVGLVVGHVWHLDNCNFLTPCNFVIEKIEGTPPNFEYVIVSSGNIVVALTREGFWRSTDHWSKMVGRGRTKNRGEVETLYSSIQKKVVSPCSEDLENCIRGITTNGSGQKADMKLK